MPVPCRILGIKQEGNKGKLVLDRKGEVWSNNVNGTIPVKNRNNKET